MTHMPLLDPPNIRSYTDNKCLADFYAIPGTSKFIHLPSREFWAAESVDGAFPKVPTGERKQGKKVTLCASGWLLRYRHVDQWTWCPGLSEIIEGKLLSEGGWIDHPGAYVLNSYRPLPLPTGDASKATPWVEHVKLLYPDDAEAVMDWFAHRVQRPWEKVNFALVMGGPMGIGKDWLIEALERAVGSSNFHTVSAADILDKNNSYVKTVVLRLNEAHDTGEGGRINRYALYERVKLYAAAPPNVLSCVDKYIRRHYVPNILGLLITTNHKADGVHLEADDRRHLVIWTECRKENFGDAETAKQFWTEKYNWLRAKGADHVAAFLTQRELAAFNPNAVPRQTEAFFEIVNASSAPEYSDLADALDELMRPAIVTLAAVVTTPRGAVLEWLLDRKSRRSIPYKMETCGYVAVRNPKADDGLWKIEGRRQTLYGKTDLTPKQRLDAAHEYALEMKPAAGNS
jgi:hypothetical protein